ncbi:hypothetical protein H072_5842 [Dactylellina haptotyla CBS 200.50]|uniref:NAD-dependent epimerase/dehydratase domain-containing protein n=1 Tax=Dactylellina haptotyla (strain CBS 200.50) TaxID=1284197 RepID=S8ABN3_DACHA|nr:hypothetical protein H072_5842 [Dactylellina haptotyla CBS 200.50]
MSDSEIPITIPKLKLFITGGTGYIGGAILTALLRSPDLEITALVRSESAIETLTSPTSNPKFFTGSTPKCVLGSLSDLELLQKIASESDIVVNCASANDLPSAETLIRGLAQGVEGTKKIFIHTLGTSAFAVWNNGDEGGSLIDDTTDLVALMRYRNEEEEYGHRTVALKVVEIGKEVGVKTFVIVPPTIYGQSPALIPRMSVQLPPLVRTAIETKKARYIGSGNAMWSNVHITDLSNLYEIILRCGLSGAAKCAEEGIYFASNGEKSWKDVAYDIKGAVEAIDGWDGGEIKPESWGVEAAACIDGVNGPRDAMLAFGSNIITVPTRSLELGWKPVFHGEAFVESLRRDARTIWSQLNATQETSATV